MVWQDLNWCDTQVQEVQINFLTLIGCMRDAASQLALSIYRSRREGLCPACVGWLEGHIGAVL